MLGKCIECHDQLETDVSGTTCEVCVELLAEFDVITQPELVSQKSKKLSKMESEEIEFAVTPGLRSQNSMNDMIETEEETQIQPISDDDWNKIPLLAKNKQFVDWIGQESVLNETPNFKKVKSTDSDPNHVHTFTLS